MLELFDTTQIALGRAKLGALQRHDALAANVANANNARLSARRRHFHTSLAAAMRAGKGRVKEVEFAVRTCARRLAR